MDSKTYILNTILIVFICILGLSISIMILSSKITTKEKYLGVSIFVFGLFVCLAVNLGLSVFSDKIVINVHPLIISAVIVINLVFVVLNIIAAQRYLNLTDKNKKRIGQLAVANMGLIILAIILFIVHYKIETKGEPELQEDITGKVFQSVKESDPQERSDDAELALLNTTVTNCLQQNTFKELIKKGKEPFACFQPIIAYILKKIINSFPNVSLSDMKADKKYKEYVQEEYNKLQTDDLITIFYDNLIKEAKMEATQSGKNEDLNIFNKEKFSAGLNKYVICGFDIIFNNNEELSDVLYKLDNLDYVIQKYKA